MSQLLKKIILLEREKKHDPRGWFLKTIDGHEPFNSLEGEIYVTSAKPGQSKGGHYHQRANEWFTLITGKSLVTLFDLDTHEKLTLEMDSTQPSTLFVPPKVAHIFTNTSNTEDFILMAYTDRLYEAMDTISFDFSR